MGNEDELLAKLREMTGGVVGKLTCCFCGHEFEIEIQPLPPEQCGGRKGFYFYEVDCPKCGRELESVLKEREAGR